MRACVSPPQESVSHMVEVAAIMAQAASTALPPRSKIMAPAVAASGLPVTAIQCAASGAERGAVERGPGSFAVVRISFPVIRRDGRAAAYDTRLDPAHRSRPRR